MEPNPQKPILGPLVTAAVVTSALIWSAAYYFGTQNTLNRSSGVKTLAITPTAAPITTPLPTQTPTLSPSPTPTPEASPSPQNVALTPYQNKTHGYTLSYPSNWTVDTTDFKSDDLVLLSPQLAEYIKRPEETEWAPDFEITYYASIKDLPTTSGTNNYTSLIDYLKGEKGTPQVDDYVAKKVGSYNTYQVTIGGLGITTAYFFEKDGHIYSLNFPNQLNADALNILSSFKFIN